MMVSLEFHGKNNILLLINFFEMLRSTNASLKWAHEMQYYVLTVTRDTVSSPLWNPLCLLIAVDRMLRDCTAQQTAFELSTKKLLDS